MELEWNGVKPTPRTGEKEGRLSTDPDLAGGARLAGLRLRWECDYGRHP
jgi:hypothetical protein